MGDLCGLQNILKSIREYDIMQKYKVQMPVLKDKLEELYSKLGTPYLETAEAGKRLGCDRRKDS